MFEDELKQIQEISIRQEAVPVSDNVTDSGVSDNTNSASTGKNELIEFIDMEQINNIDYSQIEQTNTETKVRKLFKEPTSFLKFIKYTENNKTTGYYILVNKAELNNKRFDKLIEIYPNGCLLHLNVTDRREGNTSVLNYTHNYFLLSPFVFNKNNSGIFKLDGAKIPGYAKQDNILRSENLYVGNDIKLICVWFDGVVLDTDSTAKLSTELSTFLYDCLIKLEKEESTAKKRKLYDTLVLNHAKEKVSEKMGKVLNKNILSYLSTDGKRTPARIRAKPSENYRKYGYTQYDLSPLKGFAILNGMNVGTSTVTFDMLINVLHTAIEEYKLMKL